MVAVAEQTAISWPAILVPNEIMFHPEVPSRSGGMSITGIEQVTISLAGRWRAAASFSIMHRDTERNLQDLVLSWRAMLARNQGRSNSFLIGPYDEGNTPDALEETAFGGTTTYSDSEYFDDGTEFYQAECPASIVDLTLAVGSVSINIYMEAGHIPEPGQYFGIGERLYLISTVEENVTASPHAGDIYTIGFWPSLRDVVSYGDPVKFNNPVCKMRFKADENGELSMQRLYEGAAAIELVEVP